MGFWGAASRMIQGKPVFEVPPSSDGGKDDWDDEKVSDQQQKASADGSRIHRNQRIDSRGNKVVPEAEIAHTRVDHNGQLIEMRATINNSSQFPVMLDKSIIFGYRQELDYVLSPGESREFMIYRGAERRDEAYKYAELYYKDNESGDYFCATHVIGYQYGSDGIYDVTDLRLVRPIKDV